MKNTIKNTIYLLIGCLLMACAVNFIVVPNEIIAGGVSGLAAILEIKFNIDKVLVVILADALLLIYAFFFLSRAYAAKAVLGSIFVFPLLLEIIPTLHIIDDQLLAAICCGVLTGSGVYFLYLSGGSTGGTTIVGMIIHKYFKIRYGVSVALADGVIVIFGLIAFGIESTLYALVSIAIMSITAQYLETGLKKVQVVHVITTQSSKLIHDLSEELNICKVVSRSEDNVILLIKSTNLHKLTSYVEENNLAYYTTTASSTYGEALSFFENAGK